MSILSGWAIATAPGNFDIGGEPKCQYFQPIGHLLCPGRIRQTIADDIVEAIDLVGEDATLCAQHITITKTRTLESPVPGAINGKASRTEGNATAPTGINAANGIQTEG